MKPTFVTVVFEVWPDQSDAYVNDRKRYDQDLPREIREALWLRDQLQVVYEDGYLDGQFTIPALKGR